MFLIIWPIVMFIVIFGIAAAVGISKEMEIRAAQREYAERKAREAQEREAARFRKAQEAAKKAAAKAVEADKPKRGPGRPRKNPLPDPNAPKCRPGRPRKNPIPAAESNQTAPAAQVTVPASPILPVVPTEPAEIPYIHIPHIKCGYYEMPTSMTPEVFESLVC